MGKSEADTICYDPSSSKILSLSFPPFFSSSSSIFLFFFFFFFLLNIYLFSFDVLSSLHRQSSTPTLHVARAAMSERNCWFYRRGSVLPPGLTVVLRTS